MTKQSQNIGETISSSSIREEADGKVAENETTEISEVKLNGNAVTVIEESEDNNEPEKIEIDKVEITRVVEEKIEIITDINENPESEEVELRKKGSGISRSDSFSVKEQIEQIERQIKELESKNLTNNNNNNNNNNNATTVTVEEMKFAEPTDSRLSIQAKRQHFFKNMVSNDSNVKIEIKELPREQREIQVVKLTDPPVEIEAPKEPVKIVELHISEPIKRVPEIVDDFNVNPLPKPRRHSQSSQSQCTLNSDSVDKINNDSSNSEGKHTRGDSM